MPILKSLTITNRDDYRTYFFTAYELPTGEVVVPGETTHDEWFDNRDDYQPNGLDVNESIEEDGEMVEWSDDQLVASVQGSAREFGFEAIPASLTHLLA